MKTRLPILAQAANSILFLLLSFQFVTAQSNPLHRKITLRISDARLDDALYAISEKGNFSFSYNPDLFPVDSVISLNVRRTQVKRVMESIFDKRMTYVQVGNHLVIRRRKAATLPVEPPAAYQIEGFLIDGTTGGPVRFATVYEDYKRTSILTDNRGKYRLSVPGSARQVALSFSKRGYRDTVLVVRPSRAKDLTVGLQSIPNFDVPIASRPITLVGDSDDDLPLVELFVPEKQQRLSDNVLAALASFPIQISLVPAIGTNKLLSGSMNNNFSLNILGGYSHGVRGVELGGLFNIDREHMYGAQLAGLANVVGGNVVGLQAGGIFNHVRGSLTGIQLGGIHNLVSDTLNGFQVGGIGNVATGKVTGFQIGGIYNSASRGVDGGQIAGIVNRSKGDVRALQIGGIANTADSVGIAQIAGILNTAKENVGGFQISGLFNIAKGNVKGFQIGGIYNQAKKVDGVQIGLINVADSVGGVGIGLINIVRKGYRTIELSHNEVLQGQVAWKTGNRRLYNILAIGGSLEPGARNWAYGAGFGTLRNLGPLSLSAEALCYHVNEESFGPGRLNLLIPGRVSVGINLGAYLELYAGGSINLHITNPQNAQGEFISDIGNKPFWVHEGYNTKVQSWIGYQGGLRINLDGGQFRQAKIKKKTKQTKEEKEQYAPGEKQPWDMK